MAVPPPSAAALDVCIGPQSPGAGGGAIAKGAVLAVGGGAIAKDPVLGGGGSRMPPPNVAGRPLPDGNGCAWLENARIDGAACVTLPPLLAPGFLVATRIVSPSFRRNSPVEVGADVLVEAPAAAAAAACCSRFTCMRGSAKLQ